MSLLNTQLHTDCIFICCNSLLWQYEMNQVAINYVLSVIFHFLGSS